MPCSALPLPHAALYPCPMDARPRHSTCPSTLSTLPVQAPPVVVFSGQPYAASAPYPRLVQLDASQSKCANAPCTFNVRSCDLGERAGKKTRTGMQCMGNNQRGCGVLKCCWELLVDADVSKAVRQPFSLHGGASPAKQVCCM